MANVRDIMKTELPGADGGVSVSGSSPSIPTAIASMGGISGAIPNMNAISPEGDLIQPVQAYVVENDISDAQALQEELDIQATL
jgi:hypothetical protein